MEEIKVSVVMPFHNGEAYIHETMECVCNQTLKEIEIICVDDESIDQTPSILHEYKNKDSRIQIIEQKKSNAGVARNAGLSLAKGEYIIFLDSDDLFEKDMLLKMYERAKNEHADVCVCNANQYDTLEKEYIEKPQYLRNARIPKEEPFSKETIGKNLFYFTTSVPWNKLIKKTFLEENQIVFQDIERANDQYFALMVLYLAKSIVTVKDKLVHYRINQKENLTTKFSETPLCAYYAMLAVKESFDKLGALENEDIRCAFDNKILNLMLYSLNIQNSLAGYSELYNLLRDRGFEELGVVLHEEEYYFSKLECYNFKLIKQNTCEEFLLLKNKEYRKTIATKNNAINILTKEKEAIIKDLQKTEKELDYIKGRKWYQFIAKMAKLKHTVFRKK